MKETTTTTRSTKRAKFLLIEKEADLKNPATKIKIEHATVVFIGNKLSKNQGESIRDRVGTLFAKSEISKAQRNFHPDEVETIIS